MKSKSIRNRLTHKLAARMAGVCMAAGLSVAAVTPAHADIYAPYGGQIRYVYTDDAGREV